MTSRRQKLLTRISWYPQSSLKHIIEEITGNNVYYRGGFYYRGGRYIQVSLYPRLMISQQMTPTQPRLRSWTRGRTHCLAWRVCAGIVQCLVVFNLISNQVHRDFLTPQWRLPERSVAALRRLRMPTLGATPKIGNHFGSFASRRFCHKVSN